MRVRMCVQKLDENPREFQVRFNMENVIVITNLMIIYPEDALDVSIISEVLNEKIDDWALSGFSH